MTRPVTPDRTRQVWQLLASMADWEPGPGGSVQRGALPGEIGVERSGCPGCDGTGRLKAGAACRRCHGRGWVAVDPQTGLEAAGAPDPDDFRVDVGDLVRSVRWRRVRCDRCGGQPGDAGCARCGGTGNVDAIDTRLEQASMERTRREWGGDPQPPEWWLSAALGRKRAQWQRGSYPELERLLDELRDRSPAAFAIVDVHVIHPIGIRVGPRREQHLAAIVAWLTERMPVVIRVPDEARAWSPHHRESLWRGRTRWHQAQREERDQHVRALVAASSVANAALEMGLTERRVRQIVADTMPVATAA